MLLNVGDTITQGQHVGYSGNTGYNAFPHLHFQVQDMNGNNIATLFSTKKQLPKQKFFRIEGTENFKLKTVNYFLHFHAQSINKNCRGNNLAHKAHCGRQ